MDAGHKWALDLLLTQAGQDHGGAGRCARFLLSLWVGGSYKVDLQDLMYIDEEYFSAMLMVYRYLHDNNKQLDQFVTGEQMAPVIAMWGRADA